MSVTYSNPALVTAVKRTENVPIDRSVSGYGSKLPTCYMLKYGDSPQWRRVYVMQYGNSGSSYFLVKGETVFLDTDTSHRIMNT